MPDPTTFNRFVRQQAELLRAGDRAPRSLEEWQTKRKKLRQAMLTAMGSQLDKPCALEPRIVGVLKRKNYRIEKILFQSRPDVWVSSSFYVPEPLKHKAPAVLVVHGHWPGARRDPVVQARCLGLVHLGFVVLAVDAFSAGERHPTIASGTYHGALLGSTLWPAGLTLLGLQVYDNRRAVDYLLTRPEVDSSKIGITGASGGGNQSMYAGALDERLAAVVPVCSVGTYQAYLQAACCVCEVLPGALRFTEEGEVLGLIAPRALLVINATEDAFQFSVGEAKKSLSRTKEIFKLYGHPEKLQHVSFESRHDYNRAMREMMYGFMTRWLKDQGEGKPIPEPAHEVDKPEDLACFPAAKRPSTFLFPPDLAAQKADRLLRWEKLARLDHLEAWEAQSALMRTNLDEVLHASPPSSKREGKWGNKTQDTSDLTTQTLILTPEPGIDLDITARFRAIRGKRPACVLLHLDGKDAALKHPLAEALLGKGWAVYAPDLRATGAAKPARDGIRDAPDHNSCEHALWIGRPLLGQWVVDVRALLDFLADVPDLDRRRFSLIGLGQAGVLALVAAGLLTDRLRSVALMDSWTTLVPSGAYPPGTRMALLAPGILRVGDLPHLAALIAPRKLIVAGGQSAAGKTLDHKQLSQAFAFTRKIYRVLRADESLVLGHDLSPAKVVEHLP